MRVMGFTASEKKGWMFRSKSWSACLAAASMALAMGTSAWARDANEVNSVSTVIAVSALPAQGQEVWRQIHQGGPFQYEKDGTVFGNRERLLPVHRRGFYREYTVPTPGLKHRGARRIVCGGQVPRKPEACYYTADHYSSFKQIVQ